MTNKLKFTDKETGAWGYTSEARGRFYVQAYRPKATRNHAFFYAYATAEARDAKLAAFFKSIRDHKASVAKSRKERFDKPTKLQVGTVLTGSWGYDQTNAEAYQVVEIVGKCTVKIRKVSQTSAGGEGFMCQNVIPAPDCFVGEEVLTRRVIDGKTVKLHAHCWLTPWNGRPEYSSWYA